MKKLLLLFALLISSVVAFAFDTNESFGIKTQDSLDGYQQYVGKTFYVRDDLGDLESWQNSGYYLTHYGTEYTITKVTTKETTFNGEPTAEVTIDAVEVGGKTKIKFRGYHNITNNITTWRGYEKWPVIGHMPIVFTEPFNEFSEKHVGDTISHKLVKDKYVITHFYIGKGDKCATTCAFLENTRTGETVKCKYAEINSAPFETALEGRYTLALTNVEKPEDSTNRYSQTNVITDNDVKRYSYTDSIIDIIIFATSKQFNFSLKNVSNNSLKIIWDDAAFVGMGGSTSKIMHSGIKFTEREASQPATTIIKGARLEDIACPTANVYYDTGKRIGYTTYDNGWKVLPMVPTTYIGKELGEMRLMLPIQIKDVVNEYTFVFKVTYSYDHPELLNTDQL